MTLYLGDCREIVPTILIDRQRMAVVSDVPYGIAHKHSGGGVKVTNRGGTLPPKRHTRPIEGDAEPFDPSWLLRYPEVLIWGADHYRLRLPETGRFLAWNKLAYSTLVDNFSDVEFAWHSHGKASSIFTYLWKGVQQAGEKDSPRFHPTQKPIELMRWCIGELRDASSIIFDPYMGAGATGIAAVRLRRSFVGIEIDPEYFDTSCRRIAKALSEPPDMFAEKAQPLEQTRLDV